MTLNSTLIICVFELNRVLRQCDISLFGQRDNQKENMLGTTSEDDNNIKLVDSRQQKSGLEI